MPRDENQQNAKNSLSKFNSRIFNSHLKNIPIVKIYFRRYKNGDLSLFTIG